MAAAPQRVAELALEAAGIGGWELDVSTGALHWTRLTFQIHDLDPGGTAPPLDRAIDFYAPEARPVIEAAVTAAIRDGTPWDLDLPLVTARRRRIWVRACGRAIRRRGRTLKLFGAFEDITARREVAQREARLSEVARRITNVVLMLDREGRVEWVNNAFTLTTGWKLDDVRGRWPRDVLNAPDTDPAIVSSIDTCVREGRAYEVEVLNRARDGRLIWMSIAGTPVRDATGDLAGFISVETDVTARREAEQRAGREAAERVRAEALLRDVLNSLPSGITAYDADERFILANTAYAGMFPIAAACAVPGRKLEDVFRMAADRGQYADLPAAPAEREAWLTQFLHYARSGTTRTMRLADGRLMEVRETRSASGLRVTVRSDVTNLNAAQEIARVSLAERDRVEVLLRDILDTLPIAVTAYDRDDRFVLGNRAFAEMFPIAAGFAAPGRRLDEMLTLAAQHGQYADAPIDPAELASWVARQVEFQRAPLGEARTQRLIDGRYMQVRERRSAAGTLVSVRADTTDHHAAEAMARREAAERERAEALMRDILDSVPSAIIAYDRDERLVLWNQAAIEMMPNVAPYAVPGLTLTDMLRLSAEHGQYSDVGDTPEARAQWLARQLAAYRGTGEPRTLELPDGRFVQARESHSKTGNLVCVRTDTSELVRAQALLRDALDALPSSVTAYDRDERLILTNRAHAEMFPIAARFSRPGARLEDVLRSAARQGQFPEAGTTPRERALWLQRRLEAHRTPGPPRTIKMPNGRFVQARERRSESGVTVCIRTDTTDLNRAEQDMRLQAERDALTLLANRPAFLVALDQALAGEASHTGGALFLLDVDYFKQINDTLGHDMGDALLIEIAARLRGLLRAGDVAARLGGDEFAVVIPGLTSEQALRHRMDSFHAALSATADLGGRRTPIGISVGVTVFPTDGTDAAKLMKNADLALYEAKRNGRGRWVAFRPEQALALEHHVHMAEALRRALAQNEITAALQPKRELRGGGHAGFEALARWHDGTRWVPPSEFIPVAEDTGLIGRLGRMVMDSALASGCAIRAAGLDPGRIAVNVTGAQLLDPAFMPETLSALSQHGLQPADLELELTETVLLGRAAERIDGVLRDFSALGITIALDDFGTGYASLSHLSRLPIDRLKIDRSFVEGIGAGGPGGVITRTLISLAHNLDLESIAEGIETQEQLVFLEAAGCQARLFNAVVEDPSESVVQHFRSEARQRKRNRILESAKV